ncbi:hypothetical protein [Nocardia miyunensis]|uniref:hypothetical protein n=1 Tax=Nocardia miyunensis TaxID=282684 RepID=UPI000AAB908D|nr:hypothetical protein [Nocardia miyunensis]
MLSIAGHEEAQAEAAAAISAEGYSDDEIADVLETSPRRVRQLIARHRKSERSGDASSGSGLQEQSGEVAEKPPGETDVVDKGLTVPPEIAGNRSPEV